MDNKFLDELVCPVCYGELIYDQDVQELICRFDRIAFPIKDDIPVMLVKEARELAPDEELNL